MSRVKIQVNFHLQAYHSQLYEKLFSFGFTACWNGYKVFGKSFYIFSF